MDNDTVRIAQAYARVGNLRETAELFGVSHVAVLRSLRRLEAEWGPLLTRTGRNLTFTRRARELLESLGRLASQEEGLRADWARGGKGGRDPRRPWRIATFEVFSTHLAPEIAACLGVGAQTLWTECLPGAIERQVADGEADFGITYLPVPQAGVETVACARAEMGIFGRPALWAGEAGWARLPFVVPAKSAGHVPTRALGLDGWPDGEHPRRVVARTTMLETALALARAGQAVGFFPAFVVARANAVASPVHRLARFPGALPPRVDRASVYLVKPRSEAETPELRRVARLLRSLRAPR